MRSGFGNAIGFVTSTTTSTAAGQAFSLSTLVNSAAQFFRTN